MPLLRAFRGQIVAQGAPWVACRVGVINVAAAVAQKLYLVGVDLSVGGERRVCVNFGLYESTGNFGINGGIAEGDYDLTGSMGDNGATLPVESHARQGNTIINKDDFPGVTSWSSTCLATLGYVGHRSDTGVLRTLKPLRRWHLSQGQVVSWRPRTPRRIQATSAHHGISVVVDAMSNPALVRCTILAYCPVLA